MQHTILAWPRALKRLVVLAMDVALSLLATWLAFSLRLDTLHWPEGLQWRVYALAPVLAIPVFIRLGLYRAIFRYTGQAALLTTAKAVLIYGGLLLGILLWMRWENVPRSLGVLQPLIFLLLVGGSRALARFWLAGLGRAAAGPERFLIYGAGMAGAQTAAALGMTGGHALLAFADDDKTKIGRSINGVQVHAGSEVPELVRKLGVTDILLALPSITREQRNRIIEGLRHLPVHIRTLPGMADLASGRVTVQDFRELDIEDLLGRDPVPPDAELLARDLAHKTVLVTGAGGSIGSELCRQILRQQPSRLLLLDHSEYALYSIHQELEQLCRHEGMAVDVTPLLGSVNHEARLREICELHRPHTVYHAAAYKHVPMVESNPAEGARNNVFGTLNMARVARNCGVARFVLVSTDKAVRPTNIMGASKRMAELVLQAMAADGGPTCFSMVRFGNVLGSSGSVVPLFRRQLEAGGPLTVTHAEVTRYFMTIPEAAQLVLQAGAMAQGGEVFVLDMGEPVRILDLAHRMVELSGLTVRDAANPQGDIEIAITGLRPGEKLYEELLIGNNPTPTPHPRIMKAHEDCLPWPELQQKLERLLRAAEAGDEMGIRAVLQACVHGFQSGAPQ
jgi:FlaA1/EpsC-like NDP-sugar epimerase